MKKNKYILNHLDCANCALKIEDQLNKETLLQNVKVNFNTLTLSFESNLENPKKYVSEIIAKIEPDVIVSEKIEKTDFKIQIIRLFIGVFLGIIANLVKLPFYINDIILIMAYCILLYRTFKNAIKMIIRSKTINENFLITISCVGAYLVGEHMEGLMVITLYEIGKILEEKAVNKSRKSIEELMNIRPQYANLKTGNKYSKVYPEKVKINDIIVVKKGEKIPLDGIVIKGTTHIDAKALTGESDYRYVTVNDSVLSGSINAGEVIEIKVTSNYENSTVNRILTLVEEATDKKAKTENFVSKAAKIYTPIVLLLAIITVVVLPFFFSVSYSESIYRALIFLVISCPCAIAISVPLSYFSAIGKASKLGILIKGSNYLDILKDVNMIVFDKTGTLTTGNFIVTEVISLSNKYLEKDILDLFAKGEYFSNHPIALSILNSIDYKIEVNDVKDYTEILGKGIEYSYLGKKYSIHKLNEDDEKIYLFENDQQIGAIVIDDQIKDSSRFVIQELKHLGLKTMMFTGDNEKSAHSVYEAVGLDTYKSNMLPNNKYDELKKILENNKVAFVGDGINDAPVLALADVGISMGGIGSASAIEASDIVIMNDDLMKIHDAIMLSFRTNRIIKQNLIFAISTKVIILILSIFGIAGMWEAIFADVGVTLLTILNSLRILNK